ncbi:MAG: hypothetical protein EOM74_04660 [Methanomicrobia archaeon]|nr:hypothetical protein [Methanomicrobia archaeon]
MANDKIRRTMEAIPKIDQKKIDMESAFNLAVRHRKNETMLIMDTDLPYRKHFIAIGMVGRKVRLDKFDYFYLKCRSRGGAKTMYFFNESARKQFVLLKQRQYVMVYGIMHLQKFTWYNVVHAVWPSIIPNIFDIRQEMSLSEKPYEVVETESEKKEQPNITDLLSQFERKGKEE